MSEASGLMEEPGPAIPAPALTYVICTAPRTGSTLLTDALTGTGVAGRPDEFFDVHPENELAWVRRFNMTADTVYLDRVVSATMCNDVFGFKLHLHQIPALRRRLGQALGAAADTPWHTLLQARFGEVRYIWLSRRDKVAQAISYQRAILSGQWRDRRGPGALAMRPPDPGFDLAVIEEQVQRMRSFDLGWSGFFRETRLPALALVYEDFVQDYERTVRGVLDYLKLPQAGTIVPPPKLHRQADQLSEEWRQRYLAERRTQGGALAQGAPAPAARPAAPTSPARPAEGAALSVTAFDVGSPVKVTLTAAPSSRAWMDATNRRFAYRCLPMVIANQWGWHLQTPERVEVIWDGTSGMEGVEVRGPGGGKSIVASSHFGHGIVTFQAGYLFRTPPGWNLHVRGPANLPKDGIFALEGVVESDWTEATFTMNWKLTRPDYRVVFEAGEPFAMMSPVQRGMLESCAPQIRPLRQDAELQRRYAAWSRSRDEFNAGLKQPGSAAQKAGWQKDYIRGRSVDGVAAATHQTSIAVREFEDLRGPPATPP